MSSTCPHSCGQNQIGNHLRSGEIFHRPPSDVADTRAHSAHRLRLRYSERLLAKSRTVTAPQRGGPTAFSRNSSNVKSLASSCRRLPAVGNSTWFCPQPGTVSMRRRPPGASDAAKRGKRPGRRKCTFTMPPSAPSAKGQGSRAKSISTEAHRAGSCSGERSRSAKMTLHPNDARCHPFLPEPHATSRIGLPPAACANFSAHLRMNAEGVRSRCGGSAFSRIMTTKVPPR